MILRNIAVALALGLASAAHADPLMIESQGSFFIGGHDVKSDALSGLSAYDAAGTVTVDQCTCISRCRLRPRACRSR